MNFIWVHRHYMFEGRRVRVTRTFPDTVVIQDVIPFQSPAFLFMDRTKFAKSAELINEPV